MSIEEAADLEIQEMREKEVPWKVRAEIFPQSLMMFPLPGFPAMFDYWWVRKDCGQNVGDNFQENLTIARGNPCGSRVTLGSLSQLSIHSRYISWMFALTAGAAVAYQGKEKIKLLI